MRASVRAASSRPIWIFRSGMHTFHRFLGTVRLRPWRFLAVTRDSSSTSALTTSTSTNGCDMARLIKAFGKNEPQRHRDAEKTRQEKQPAGGVAIHPPLNGLLC